MLLNEGLGCAGKMLDNLFRRLARELDRDRNQGKDDEDPKTGLLQFPTVMKDGDHQQQKAKQSPDNGEVIEQQMNMGIVHGSKLLPTQMARQRIGRSLVEPLVVSKRPWRGYRRIGTEGSTPPSSLFETPAGSPKVPTHPAQPHRLLAGSECAANTDSEAASSGSGIVRRRRSPFSTFCWKDSM